ncbi:MAG: hypothetical protein ACI4RJ_04360 [Alphaproteobacteria bacterium]
MFTRNWTDPYCLDIEKTPTNDAQRAQLTMDIIEKYRHYKNPCSRWTKEDSTFKLCMKTGDYREAIARVNDGVDDDQTVYQDQTLKCPSVLVARNFYYLSDKDISSKGNDILYLYRKLKEKGLNKPVIEAYAKKQRWDVRAVFKEMDRLLKIPEEERFKSKNPEIPKVIRQRKSLYKDLIAVIQKAKMRG